MTFAECPREQDVIDAVTTDRWPDRCGDDLEAHVATCEGCRDLVAVIGPLSEAWESERGDAVVPAAGMVWWRAQMRARQEATRTAARPITVVQGIAGLAGGALALIGLVAVSPMLASSVAASRSFLSLDVQAIGAMQGSWLLAGGAAALLAATSLAVYLVVAED